MPAARARLRAQAPQSRSGAPIAVAAPSEVPPASPQPSNSIEATAPIGPSASSEIDPSLTDVTSAERADHAAETRAPYIPER